MRMASLAGLALLPLLVPPAHTLAAQRAVEGNRIVSKALPAAVLEVAKDLTYAGNQSFDLYNVANAEQHFFVERDGNRIKRLLWIQFEGYKPDNTNTYNYTDTTISHSGQTWHRRRAPVTIPSTEARPDSDGARTRGFLREKGWTLGPDVMTERLVWILDSPARNELMIIYMEDLADHGLAVADLREGGKARDRWPEIGEAFHQRALAAFSVR